LLEEKVGFLLSDTRLSANHRQLSGWGSVNRGASRNAFFSITARLELVHRVSSTGGLVGKAIMALPPTEETPVERTTIKWEILPNLKNSDLKSLISSERASYYSVFRLHGR
jgi:hypothetical protein